MTRTITDMWQQACTDAADRNAFMFRVGDDWTHMTFGDAYARTATIGAGMIAQGMAPGENVSILADSSLEWTLCDYAVLGTGAALVPIYPTSSPTESQYILEHCEATSIIVENAAQYVKVEEIRPTLPKLRQVIVIDTAGLDDQMGHNGLVSLIDIEAAGKAAGNDAWLATSKAVRPDTTATIIYTSGTTGPPKGCLQQHHNVCATVEAIRSVGDALIREDDRVVLFLTLAHTLTRSIQFAAARLHAELGYSSPLTLMDDLQFIKPNILPSVPRVFEKAHTRIAAMLGEATGPKAKLIAWALRVGHMRNQYKWVLDKSVPLFLRPQYRIANKLVFSKIHERFGGQLRLAVSGGAPLARDVQMFFLDAGLPIVEGYGLTEGMPLTVGYPGSFQPGSVGKAVGDTVLKIAEDGEILAQSEMIFSCYYKNEEATAETKNADGWLHTGDIGTIDRKGFLYITDRKKDIIITAGGKNVSPQNIENSLKSTQYISQALVFGDKMPYLAALITLDPEEMETFAKANRLPGDMMSLIETPQVQDMVRAAVAKVNSEMARVEHIRRWRILPIDFTQEAGELTPTLKLKRKVLCERYGAWIDALYGTDAPDEGAITDPDIERAHALTN